MKFLNKVYLLGRLGQVPELMQTKTGQPYARLNLATKRSWKDENEKWQDVTEWHHVMVWGNQAKTCSEGLNKGSVVFVEGSLSPYTIPNEDGSKSYKLSVHAQKVTFFSPTPMESAAVAG